MAAAADEVADVRRFNRTVTERVQALSEHFLAGERPYGQARLLWEIGTEGSEVRALRARLGIDSGQLSRMLRALEADGMAAVTTSRGDARGRVAQLTEAGLAERARLDDRSDELALSLLGPLDEARRTRLVDAMRTVERLLTAGAVEVGPIDPSHPDARHCIRSYVAELNRRSERGFDPAAGITAEPHELRPPAGHMLLARLHGAPVGCGAVKHHPGEASEIKRMWVAESARGLGIGRRLLAELEALTRASGAVTAHIETNSTLGEAITLYESAGYVEVPAFNDEPFADHWFEKPL